MTRVYEAPPRRTWAGALAAFGTRRVVRFAQWRARREARAALEQGSSRLAARLAARPSDQLFRGFIQINLIRPR